MIAAEIPNVPESNFHWLPKMEPMDGFPEINILQTCQNILQGMDLQFALTKPFQGQTRCLGGRNCRDTRDSVAHGGRTNPTFVGAGTLSGRGVDDQCNVAIGQ